MAQIIKMSGGDSMPAANSTATQIKPNRHFKYNGQEVNVADPQFDKDFREILNARKIDPEVGDRVMYYYDQILNGTGDITGEYTSGKWTGLDAGDDKIQEKLSSPRGGNRRKVRNDRQALYELGEAMKEYTGRKPKETITKNDYTWNKNWTFDYDTEGEGDQQTRKFRGTTGYTNLLALLDGISKIPEMAEDQYYNKNESMDYRTAKNWVNQYKDQIAGIKERVMNGTWTDKDRTAIEAWTGAWDTKGKTGSGSGDDDEKTAAIKKQYKDAGWDYDTFKDLIAIDNDGNAKIINQNLLKFVTDAGVNDNYWLNDSFNDYTSNAFSKYIPAGKGIFVYGGNAYLGDSEKLKQIKMFQDFIEENKATGGNATGTKQWWVNGTNSGLSDLSANANGEQLYSPAFENGTNFGRDVTGDYINRPNNALVYEYIPNYDTSNAELFDEYGRPLDSKRQLIFIDPITKQPMVVSAEDAAKMQKQTNQKLVNDYYADPNRRTAFSKYYTYGANILKKPRKFIQVGGLSDPSNPGSGIIVLYDTDKKKYYLRDENPVNSDWGNINHRKMDVEAKNYMFDIPDEIGEYIANGNPITRDDYEILEANIANMYRQNGNAITKFHRSNNAVSSDLLQKLINTYYLNAGALYKHGSRHNNFNVNQAGSEDRLWILPWELLQLNQPTAPAEQQVSSNKNGGILKAASGQKVRETTKASQDAVQRSDKALRKSGQEHVIGDGTGRNTWSGMSNSDYWELGSLIADGASLVASLVPGAGGAVGAGIGAVSSLANFGADVSRDGLDWGDAKSLALNLGLDVATLFGGAAGKSMKIVHRLKNSKAIKWVLDHPKVLGLANATVNGLPIYDAMKTSYDKIQNGQWTINDIRTIIQGLRGVTNFAKTKGSAKTTNKLDTATLNAPKGSNLPSVKLTSNELETVSNAAKGEQKNVLNGILKEKLKDTKLPDGSAIPDDFDFVKEYGIKTSGVDLNWKKLWKSKKGNNINTNQFDLDTETVYRNPNEMNWWNWNRRAAIRDAKQNPDNPYFMGIIDRRFGPQRNTAGNVIPLVPHDPIKVPIADPIYGYDYRADLTPGLDTYTEENQPIYYQAYDNGGKLPDLSIVSSMLDSYKKGGIMKAKEGTKSVGTDTTKTPTESPWSNSDTNNVIDIVKLATELGAINRSNKTALAGVDKSENLIKSQKAPVINKEILDLNPIHRGAEMQRDTLNKARVIGSDSRVNNAQQLAIQDRVNEITDKENYAVSNALSQNAAMNRKIDSANASARTQLNNQIAQQLTSLENARTQYKNTGEAQKNAALQKYLIGLQTRIDKDQMSQASIRDAIAKMNASVQRNQDIYAKWGNEWAGLSKEEKEKYRDSIDTYAQTKYPNAYGEIYKKSIADYYNNSRPRNNSRLTVDDFQNLNTSTIPDEVSTEPEVKLIKFGITSSKNGSKIRPVSDQLILDTQKEAAKIINKLNDNAVKFLLKAIK